MLKNIILFPKFCCKPLNLEGCHNEGDESLPQADSVTKSRVHYSHIKNRRIPEEPLKKKKKSQVRGYATGFPGCVENV